MDPKVEKVIENIKFLEKAYGEKHVRLHELFELCQIEGMSGFTLNRVLDELSLAGRIVRPKEGNLVFFDAGVT